MARQVEFVSRQFGGITWKIPCSTCDGYQKYLTAENERPEDKTDLSAYVCAACLIGSAVDFEPIKLRLKEAD